MSLITIFQILLLVSYNVYLFTVNSAGLISYENIEKPYSSLYVCDLYLFQAQEINR